MIATRRTRGISPSKMIRDLRRYVRGEMNYYVIGLTFAEARELDEWM
ncbi:MAG: group II intron maturase-specific domain-containing protein [Verrucomicrobiota bacterium]